MPPGILSGPHFARGIFAVRILPHIVDVHRIRDLARFDFRPKQAPDYVLVDGQRILGEDRITELLELFRRPRTSGSATRSNNVAARRHPPRNRWLYRRGRNELQAAQMAVVLGIVRDERS